MPRVVADTNIYISALNFSGVADDALALGLAVQSTSTKRAINDFTVLVHPTQPVNLVHEDEADNRILECALAAGADTIITGDRHLLRLRRFLATAFSQNDSISFGARADHGPVSASGHRTQRRQPHFPLDRFLKALPRQVARDAEMPASAARRRLVATSPASSRKTWTDPRSCLVAPPGTQKTRA